MWRTSSLLSILIMISAAGNVSLSAQKGGGVALQKIARKALDEKWKHWQLASVDPQAISCRRDGGESPAVLQGDLDGDGRVDNALAIKTSEGVRLVAALTRTADVVLFDIDALGDSMANGYLGLEHRGAKFTNPHTKLEDYFTADTLTVYRCGQPPTAYIWSGLGFSKVVIP